MGHRARLLSSLLLRPAENAPLLRPFRFFSSSSSAGGDGILSFFEGSTDESPAYRRHLRCHRPPTVRPWDVPANTCSVIGTVRLHPRRCDSRSGSVGAYTLIEVEKAPWVDHCRDFSPFRILVMMWDELAKVSLKYLKPKDFIYVSGQLSSYERVADGNKEIVHKVVVKDLNYVHQPGTVQASQNPHTIDEDVPACSSVEAVQEKEDRDRLRLWQVFFANPHEWWDNRQEKPYKSSPDFKHKHTHEHLCLSPNDPPWVTKQLELYDLERAGIRQKSLGGSHSHISEFL